MKTNIITSSLLLLGILSLNLIWAQQPTDADRKAIKQAKKALHQEAQAYSQENILPVLQAQRAKLDPQLSAAEQQELTEIRTELQEMKEEHKAEMKSFREQDGGERPQERPEPSAEQIEAMRAKKKEMRLLMNRAWVIADAHESSIYQLLDELEEDKKEWKEALGQIREEHIGDLKEEHEGNRPIKPEHRGQKGGGKHMGHLQKVTSEPVAFLLWDGTMPQKPERAGRDHETGLTIFPNPSTTENQLRYTVEKGGLVTITLLDKEGVTLKTLSSKKQKAGDYTESFSLEGLTPGTYYYKVELPDERMVKRFVIK
jgi:hypothetical protein